MVDGEGGKPENKSVLCFRSVANPSDAGPLHSDVECVMWLIDFRQELSRGHVCLTITSFMSYCDSAISLPSDFPEGFPPIRFHVLILFFHVCAL